MPISVLISVLISQAVFQFSVYIAEKLTHTHTHTQRRDCNTAFRLHRLRDRSDRIAMLCALQSECSTSPTHVGGYSRRE